MTLSSGKIAKLLELGSAGDEDGVSITPRLNTDEIRKSHDASITLRLGRWISTIKESKKTFFEVYETGQGGGASDSDEKLHFIPFGNKFILHPGRFVLGVTLEWIALPKQVCGKVVGKSYVGRRGLIIETAPGVHPTFTGCLTLEMANVGEVPIILRPGMQVCQLFLEDLAMPNEEDAKWDGERDSSKSTFSGRRRPSLGNSKPDGKLSALSPKRKESRGDS